MPGDRPQLVCLCAAWCHLCGAYAPVFESVVQRLRDDGIALDTRWIDIEDDAELVGELDVETFPTLLLRRGAQVLFHGALTPQPEVLERVLRSALVATTAGAATPPVHADAAALAQRLDDAAARR